MKNIYIVIIIAFFCLAFKGGDLHSIHISISEVDYFSEKKEIQVALKIYTDDLEASIKKGGVSSLGLDSSKERDDADVFIEKYLERNFEIMLNVEEGGIGKMVYIGKEYEDAATWIYFKFDVNVEISKVKIMNKVVLNTYRDQKNIINFRKDKQLIKTGYTYKKSKYLQIEL